MSSPEDLDPLAVTLIGGGEAATPLAPGTWIGRYLVTGVLGHGGMGVVYGAHDPDLDRPVAIKLLRPELRSARARLLREGQAVARLHHPNVVTVHDVGQHGDDLFIAMELVKGATLGAWMREGPARRRPWREVLARMIPAARGLAAAHGAGLVHRDFKPENVLLGDSGRVVVSDFGLALVSGWEAGRRGGSEVSDPEERRPPRSGSDTSQPPSVPASQPSLTRTGALLGTPAYMSPEQFRGERSDARSDQFSFCVTLYEALIGTRPFDPRDGSVASVSDLQSAVERGRIVPLPTSVPRFLRRAIARGLDPDPARRFASIDELLVALAPSRRMRWVAIGAAVAVVVGVALAVAWPGRDVRLVGFDAGACDSASAVEVTGGPLLTDDAARWGAVRWAACAGRADARAIACLDQHRAALLAPTVGDYWPAIPALDDCFAPPPVATSFPEVIALGPQGVAQLSPDGRQIAVSAFGGDAVIVAADPKAYTPAPVPGARVVDDWLADGTMVVQHRDRSQALRAPDGAETPLPGPGDLLFTQINTIAPDHSRIANLEGGAVVIRAVPSGEVVASVPGLAHELAWEPDGHRLAIVSRDLATLRLWDARTGAVASISIGLHARGIGELGIAWLAPGHLLMSGSDDPTNQFGLWSIDLDEQGGLARLPTLRWLAPPGRLLRLYDVAGGRVLAMTGLSRQRMLHWHAGAVDELPASLNDVKLTAFDAKDGVAVGASGVQVVTFATDGRALSAFASPIYSMPTLHAGAHPAELHRSGVGRYAVHDLDGAQGDAFGWDETGRGWASLRCSPRDTARCVIWSHVGQTASFAPLGDPSAPITVDGNTANSIDVSPDGHVLTGLDTGDVVDLDPATGARRVVAHVDAPDCVIRHARYADPGPGAWVVLLCPDRFLVARAGDGLGLEEAASSAGWISGIEVLPGGDLLFSRMDWDPQLVVVDGLARR